VNERADNINEKLLTKEMKVVLEKVQTRPELLVYFDEFLLLLEMAAQTKKTLEAK